MIPLPMFSLYVGAAYLLWWFASRVGLLTGWFFSKPRANTYKHYLFMVFCCCPLVMEIMGSTLVIFAIAFGIDPYKKEL